MNDLAIVIVFSLIGGVFSLLGGFLLLANRKKTQNLLKYITPFAAGALLAAAFMDILPEASHQGNIDQALTWTLVGILVFFLLERFLRWFHHHHSHDVSETEATVPLIIIGDTVHNFIDGVAIAAAFLIDVPTGIITTLAVAAHEIPQELGDFGLLLDKGMKKADVIKVNILSALATTFAAVIFFQFGQSVDLPFGIILGLVAGFFIYIAVSDIIPSIHKNEGQRFAGVQTMMLIIGVILVSTVTSSLHTFLESKSEKSSSQLQENNGTGQKLNQTSSDSH